MPHKDTLKDRSVTKKVLRWRPLLLLLVVVLLLVLGGVFMVNRSNQDPAATLPRRIADQLLQGWEVCDYDKYLRAKHHAVYKDVKEKIADGQDKQKFSETCGEIQVLDLVATEKSNITNSEGVVGYRFDYKLKQTASDQWGPTVIQPLIVVGDEKDGFLVSILPFVNEEDYKQGLNKAKSQSE